MRPLYYLVPCILLCSCGRTQITEGIVLDRSTRQPLAGVQVSLNAPVNVLTHSAKDGSFRVTRRSKGFGKQPDLRLIWNKAGYTSYSHDYRSFDQDTVWLDPEQITHK